MDEVERDEPSELEQLRERVESLETMLANIVQHVGGKLLWMPVDWDEWLKDLERAEVERGRG